MQHKSCCKKLFILCVYPPLQILDLTVMPFLLVYMTVVYLDLTFFSCHRAVYTKWKEKLGLNWQHKENNKKKTHQPTLTTAEWVTGMVSYLRSEEKTGHFFMPFFAVNFYAFKFVLEEVWGHFWTSTFFITSAKEKLYMSWTYRWL